MTYVAYTDGGSQQQNKHGAGAFIITNEGNILYEQSFYYGNYTVNQSEYTSIIFCLVTACAGGITDLTIISDSQLVINQLNGSYAIKNEKLIPLYHQVKHLIKKFTNVTFKHMPRETPQIQHCDALCDQVIDHYIRSSKL